MAERTRPETVVIDPDLLRHASPEEREAYRQYLLFTALELDEWEPWLQVMVPGAASKPFAKHHAEFWEWVWGIEPDERPKPFVAIWPRGQGKPLALDTPLPTPDGWTTMGEVQVGDRLLDEGGNPCRVTHVTDVHEQPASVVSFKGGGKIVAGDNHDWTALNLSARRQMKSQDGAISPDWPNWEGRGKPRGRSTENAKARVVTTSEMGSSLRRGSEYEWAIPCCRPWELARADLPVDPYLLGYWLGDGTSANGIITVGREDVDAVCDIFDDRGIKFTKTKGDRAWRLNIVGLSSQLAEADLRNNKHLPETYLRSSADQRRDLLAGLCDSDGCSTGAAGSAVEFTNTNHLLAFGVHELAASLGMRASISEGRATLNGKDCGPKWRVRISAPPSEVFRLTRKSESVTPPAMSLNPGLHLVTSVRSVGVLPVKCVSVDSPNHLFLAGWSAIPTHNSTSAELAALVMGCRKKRNYGLYIAETQEQADDHVANVAALLESETVEIAYPDLGQRLMGKFGSAKGWRRNRVRTSTGFTLDAMGLDSAARGVKLEHQRPDFMVFDDIDGELDSEISTHKKIKTITRKLLPAGSQDCAVLMIQNMVHEDSIFARLSDGRADFLMDRIVSGPIPAIEDMEYEERESKFEIVGGTPSWPEGMPMKSCQLLMNDIGLTAFLAECQHETQPPEGDIFTHLSFARCTHAELPEFKRVTVWVDPAVTTTDRSDSMGIQCDGLGKNGRFYRLYSWEARSTPLTAIEKAVKTALRWGADTVGVETDQGGDTWEVVYHQACENLRKEGLLDGPAPRFKHAKASTGHGSKIARAERMLVDYERGKFVHLEGTHHALEQALRRFPKVKPYDLVDACLVGETLVATEDGWVPIMEISPGDLVGTRQGLRRVNEAGKTNTAEIWELVTEDGHSVQGTWDHPVWTEEYGWMPLALTGGLRLTVVPSLVLAGGPAGMSGVPWSRVAVVRSLNVSADVWNLEVEGEHEFFANGVCVHNCYWSWADLNETLTRRRMRTRSSAKQVLPNSTISLR